MSCSAEQWSCSIGCNTFSCIAAYTLLMFDSRNYWQWVGFLSWTLTSIIFNTSDENMCFMEVQTSRNNDFIAENILYIECILRFCWTACVAVTTELFCWVYPQVVAQSSSMHVWSCIVRFKSLKCCNLENCRLEGIMWNLDFCENWLSS